MTQIRTARLLLRRPRADDLDGFFTIMSDARAMRYWSTLPHASRSVTQAWLDQKLERTAAGGEDFVIERDGELIGEVGAGRLPGFGFMLRPDCWGQGYATEASAACVSHIFAAHDIPTLEADVDPRNAASLAVLGKFGFRVTGTARNTFLLGDEWCDSVYLSLARAHGVT